MSPAASEGARSSRQGGFAIADFLAGMLIFTATVMVFSGLTRSKFVVLNEAQIRSHALPFAEAQLDRIRQEGLRARPKQGTKADAQGFRLAETFPVKDTQIPGGEGRIEVRGLRIKPQAAAERLLEVRVVVQWKEGKNGQQTGRLALSTVSPQPPAKGGAQ